MMAAFILVFSLATLGMFFVSYCRSLMASALEHDLSAEVRDIAGIQNEAAGRDYERIMQILQLCPQRVEDKTGLQAVNFYHKILTAVQGTVSKIGPSLASALEEERAGCARFVAVILDRRIAFSREMLAQESEI